MGYRGLVAKQNQARELRALGMTMPDIAAQLGVSRSSVSLWTRDVEFEPQPRRPGRGRRRGPNRLQLRKQAEIDSLLEEGRRRIGELSEREFLVAGAALYAGEGSKGGLEARFANSDPRMILFFVTWLRRFFTVDEARLRMRIYLHQGLDIDAATEFWSALTGIPSDRFRSPYRAVPDPTIRHNKHVFGCPSVMYSSARTHRAIMGLVEALLTSLPGHPG
jgi:hypothetical protein